MTKILTACTFIVVVFFCSKIYAMKTLTLGPNESKQFTNSSFFPIRATCVVQANSQAPNKIRISVLKNTGSVNGRNLATGQSTSLTVRNHESISVSAQSGTQINLVNKGNQAVQALCSA